MCLQCSTKSVRLLSEVVPGYSLHRATVSAREWDADHYGVVRSNDPLFVFELTPLKSPLDKLSDEELNAMPDFPQGTREYWETAECIQAAMQMSPSEGHHFFTACLSAGYNPDEDGGLAFWLCHRMGEMLEKDCHV